MEAHVRPTRLRLAEARVPQPRENAELAERDEVRVRFTFRLSEVSSAEPASHRRRPRRAA